MPSKGIDIFSYISVDDYTVEFTVPAATVLNTAEDNFQVKHLEMNSSDIDGFGHYTGRFQWRVLHHGQEVATAYNEVNTLTGKLHGGTMTATVDFSPIVTPNAIITYGFYAAGHGEFGLTNHHQCYVTICSRANESWMGAVAPPGSQAAQKPFSRFVLAAPHDNGMNSMISCDAVLSAADQDTVDELRKHFPALRFFEEMPSHLLLHKLPNIVYGVAITQKKEIPIMLDLGARYFEFRPAKLLPIFRKISQMPDKFYFQHACIPGLAFDEFLAQQVRFLDDHPTEFVVIHIRSDNIVKDCIQPTNDQVNAMLTAACEQARKAPLSWGGRELFSQPIDTLRRAGQRLICVSHAEKYDSWTAKAYATLEAKPILDQFESMNTEGQESTDLTVLQCQGTSQSIKEVLVHSVISAHAANSCLSSTKARFDTQTLPWIRENALDRLQAERTIVIMNDFIDGATTDTSILLSRQRLEN
ncbi:hypothetical protein EMPS_00224 [Entomortierella parvispora]|uniref:PLC-like phosphodiesterase n=1 Tax=Entomortierella parvispora TaxID=205924 RepID=A0A9P3GZT1_9FUNG|nr:hypothetical protein EMPS_00224 [Entomortierella parvispora]